MEENRCDFELIRHERPIVSTQDAAVYFDLRKAAPVLVVQKEKGLVAMVVSAERGRIDLKAIKPELGFQKLKRTVSEEIERVIGYRAGAVPLIGHGLPCVFDQRLLDCNYVYGGSGDACYTLKIAPEDVKRLSRVIKTLE